MLRIVTAAEGFQRIIIPGSYVASVMSRTSVRPGWHTRVHRPEHAGDEFVDAMRLLNQRHQGRDATFVVRTRTEMGKDEFLERVDLILKGHEVGDCLIARCLSEGFCQVLMARPKHTYPSFGSLIDLRLIYSAYSNVPVDASVMLQQLAIQKDYR